MKVPLLDLQAQYAAIRDEVLEAVVRVCDSQRFIMGPEVEALEAELASALGVGHAIGVSSGTDALLVSMMALGVGPGDEVITSAYSFFATVGCIIRLGARPVLVDIEPDGFNIDPAAVERAISPRTKAIVPVHLFGQAAEIEAIVDAARAAASKGVSSPAVIEDACQAIGARHGQRAVGGFGDAGCFSFFPSKNLGAFGDGGLVTTNDGRLADRIRALRNHGAERKYHHSLVGGNFRLDALQAAVLRVKARHLGKWTEARRLNADRYRALFAAAGLDGVVRLPVELPHRYHIYNQFVVRVEAGRRDGLRSHLERSGIGTEIYYPIPFHLQECLRELGYAPGSFPEAEVAAATSLALPIYGELTEAAQEYVVASIAEFLGG